MRKEKTPDVTQGQGQKKASIKTIGSIGDQRGKVNNVKLFAQGVQTYKQPLTKPKMSGGGARGSITQWTTASRRRMRNFMLCFAGQPGEHCIGVSLTIPGPVMDTERAKALFTRFCQQSERAGDRFVWRVEIQKREQLHWHLKCYTFHPADVSIRWWDCIKAMGPETFNPPHVGKGSIYHHVENRMCIFGAAEHSVNIQQDGDSGAWLRYMQDHASKAKQEQVAVGIGRHWGVVGRKGFVTLFPECDRDLTDPEFSRYLRMHQRLATASEKSECVFGRHLRKRFRRGFRGTSTWFGSPITLSRIISASVGENRPVSSYADYIRSTT